MNQKKFHGVIDHSMSNRKTDYLYRVSLKCLIINPDGHVLVVKENSRDWWDLPGGGMDHGEDLTQAIARELKEEVSLEGNFTYRIIDIDKPLFLDAHGFWQLRIVFHVTPDIMRFGPGIDADEVSFIDPAVLARSSKKTERRVYKYFEKVRQMVK